VIAFRQLGRLVNGFVGSYSKIGGSFGLTVGLWFAALAASLIAATSSGERRACGLSLHAAGLWWIGGATDFRGRDRR